MSDNDEALEKIKQIYEKRMALRADELRLKAEAMEIAGAAGLPTGSLRKAAEGLFHVHGGESKAGPVLIQCCIR